MTCKAIKKGLIFLSEISCLQVRASYSGVTSPSFIFSWTTIAKISAYCKYIVSYCCGGNFSISLVHGDEVNA